MGAGCWLVRTLAGEPGPESVHHRSPPGSGEFSEGAPVWEGHCREHPETTGLLAVALKGHTGTGKRASLPYCGLSVDKAK